MSLGLGMGLRWDVWPEQSGGNDGASGLVVGFGMAMGLGLSGVDLKQGLGWALSLGLGAFGGCGASG